MYSYQYSEREDIFLSDSKIDKYSHALYKIIMKIAWEKLLGKNGKSQLWSHTVNHKCRPQFVLLPLQWFFKNNYRKIHFECVKGKHSLQFEASHPSRHSSSWVSAKHPRISFLPAKVSLNFRFWVACRSLLLSLLYFCR